MCQAIKKLLLIILISPISLSLSGQEIQDSLMSWKYVDKELKPDKTPHYKKVSIDPVCLGLGQKNRETIIENINNTLKLDKNQTGYLKIYFLVVLKGEIYVTRLGVQDLKLTKAQYTGLSRKINAFEICQPGIHKGEEVNCEGIIYFTVKSGKITDYTLKRIATEKRIR